MVNIYANIDDVRVVYLGKRFTDFNSTFAAVSTFFKSYHDIKSQLTQAQKITLQLRTVNYFFSINIAKTAKRMGLLTLRKRSLFLKLFKLVPADVSTH